MWDMQYCTGIPPATLQYEDWLGDPLEGDFLGKWQSLVQALHEAPMISLPRYYFADTSGDILEVNLHGFCDASTTAYAAVIYLVVTSKIGISTQLVAAKTQVAPLSQTVPRLELLAALILARLITAVATILTDAMCINSIRCWSDSKVALTWVKGEHQEWKQFVQNCVDEIRRLVPASAWSYCSMLIHIVKPSRFTFERCFSEQPNQQLGPKQLGSKVNTRSVNSLFKIVSMR